jgi:hypothetical protein
MIDATENSNAGSHVNRIPDVSIDDTGFIHTIYGTYHPVTGEGLPIDAPKELMRDILIALLRDGEESGFAEDFELNTIFAEMRSNGPTSI